MATVMQTESDLEVASRTTAKIGAVTGPALGARLEIDAAVLRGKLHVSLFGPCFASP